MKVSIKNLHITYMGAGEPLTTEIPSPLERELNSEVKELAVRLEAAEQERNALRRALLQAHKDRFAELFKTFGVGSFIEDQLTEALKEMTQKRDTLQRCNERQSETIKGQSEELAQIAAWAAAYDMGDWPAECITDAKGTVAAAVLHMIRDLQADINTRPLPPIHQQPHAGFEGTGWNASAPAQPYVVLNPVGVGQPEPKTPDTLPAAPESPEPNDPTGSIAAQAKICPTSNCLNLLQIGETYCTHCQAFNINLPKKDRPPCSVPLCDEPRRIGSIYCVQHKGYAESVRKD